MAPPQATARAILPRTQLAAEASRLAGYVGAMLAAVGPVWLLLEALAMRRIALLTRRAAAVSDNVRVAAATHSSERLNPTNGGPAA